MGGEALSSCDLGVFPLILPVDNKCISQISAGLASGEKVCLNPRASWVKKLVHFVLEKQLHQQGEPLPKNQA